MDLKIGDVVVITNFEKNTDEWSPHYKGEVSVIDRIDYPFYYLANDNSTPFTKEQLSVISTKEMSFPRATSRNIGGIENMKYNVGDRVRVKSLDWYNKNKTIHGEIWFDNAVFVGGQSLYCGYELTIRLVTDDSYYVIENDYYWTDEMIEGLVEEETLIERVDDSGLPFNEWLSHKGAFYIPDGYELKDENGNVINATKIVLEKKKKEYPKTYEECRDLIEGSHVEPFCADLVATGYLSKLMEIFARLIMCRNAYWQLYGEEMGLGKPWEPDWNIRGYYAIARSYGNVVKTSNYNCDLTFVFPTEEMRDAFYDNFKELIEFCKELL